MIVEVTNILRELSVPVHLLGFDYLRMAILICVEDESQIHNIMKGLYVSVAEIYKTSPNKVHTAIRHAIGSGISTSSVETLSEYFYFVSGDKKFGSKDKPTNGEFIASIVDRIKIANSTPAPVQKKKLTVTRF